MEDLKKLLKTVNETKDKRIEERNKYLMEIDPLTVSPSDYFKMGVMQGRIDEKIAIAEALERIIKRKEDEQKAEAEFEQALKEIEEIINLLPVLVALKVLE